MRPRLRAVTLPGEAHTEKILDIQSLHKGFHVDSGFLPVLQTISFRADRGELICILGRSGCGKSTLLKILAGFIPPSSGRILLKGKAVLKPGSDRCVIFQEDALFPWLTVKENIAFGLKSLKGDRKSKAKEVDRFLGLVGMGEFRDYLPQDISGGMKQRVALARVLILKPEVLLMDEPFVSLDAQSREEMQNLLLSLWHELGHTILFVTHDVNEAVILADKILLMNKNPGRIREEIRVALPRPRSRESGAFLNVSRRLHEALRD
ncbi:MAG: ABC transporter ATP-binding protein [Deltaproteobacteria bacterium]|nr:ABC transporter ATP-binding protein [Deltaproteobacteria bacterium]